MRLNTTEYSAVKGGSKKGAKTNPVDYLDQIALDYTDMKDEYKDIFSAAGDLGGSTTAKAAFTENKMKELDLMIENMVKQFIKGNLND